MQTDRIKIMMCFLLLSTFVWAQDIIFDSKVSSSEVSVGDRIVIGFYVTVKQKSIKIDAPIRLPDFKGLHVLGENTVRQVQFVNGHTSYQVGKELTLVANREGNYQIGSAKITLGGKEYRTDSIFISVENEISKEPKRTIRGAFLEAKISNTNPYLNEGIVLSVNFYAVDQTYINRREGFIEPNLVGEFLIKDVSNDQLDGIIRQEKIKGIDYRREELAKYILYPQQTGNLEIGSFLTQILISGYYGAEGVDVISEPIDIKVNPLPSLGQPENFSGAVGKFKLETHIDTADLKSKKGINLYLELIGEGNFLNIKLPQLKPPREIEVYNPTQRNAYKVYNEGIKGKIEVKYVLVPQYGGEYKIDPVMFSYFDPKERKYNTIASQAINLKIEGDAAPKNINGNTDSTADKLDSITEKDTNSEKIDVLKLINTQLDKKSISFSKSNKPIFLGIGALLLTLMVLLFFLFFRKKSVKKQKKIPLETFFKGQLNELKKNLSTQDIAEFYVKQEHLLVKLGMDLSGVSQLEFSDEVVIENLLDKGYKKETLEDWKNLLANARKAKYAQHIESTDLSQLYLNTEKAVNQMLKRK